MLKANLRALSAGLLGADIALLALTFLVAHRLTAYQVLLRRGEEFARGYTQLHTLEAYLPILFVGMVVWAAYGRWFGTKRVKPLSDEFNEMVARTVAVAISTIAAIFLLRMDADSRIFIGVWCGLLFAVLSTARLVVRWALREAQVRGYSYRRLAIAGNSAVALRVADTVRRSEEQGLQLAGFILPSPDAKPVDGGPVLGTLDEIARIVDANVIDDVIFAVEGASLERYEEALAACEEAGVNSRIVLDFFPHKFSRMELEELDGFPMLSFHATANDPFALLTKRVFDLAVAGAAVMFGSPIYLAVALAVKLTSPGPVFFTQRRVGLNGREFTLYKFRSMVVDAEQQLANLKSDREGPAFKMENDPRVTAVGGFIRRFSLDEIPQFFNVLFGDMSIVGPRPPMPHEVARYERWQRRRLSVRPGITCIWQVSGRNKTDFETWMQQDLQYIDSWNLWLDLKIFLKTIPAVLLARGSS